MILNLESGERNAPSYVVRIAAHYEGYERRSRFT